MDLRTYFDGPTWAAIDLLLYEFVSNENFSCFRPDKTGTYWPIHSLATLGTSARAMAFVLRDPRVDPNVAVVDSRMTAVQLAMRYADPKNDGALQMLLIDRRVDF